MCVPVYASAGASTHWTSPQRDGQVELTWMTGKTVRWFTNLLTVTHVSTNWAESRITSLIENREQRPQNGQSS